MQQGKTRNMTPEIVCSELQKYWRDRGYEIETNIVIRTAIKVFDDGTQSKVSCGEVASNLVNGLPPGWNGDARKAEAAVRC